MFDRLIELLKQFGRLFLFWDIINPYDGGIVLRLGKFRRNTKPGLNWIWPFLIERVISVRTATQTLVVGPQSLMTTDGKTIVVSVVATCRVSDPKTFIIAIEGGISALDDAATGAVSELIMKHSLDELREMNLNLRLSNAIKKLAEPWGVTVDRVQVQDFTIMRSLRLLQHIQQSYAESKEF